MGKKRTKDMLPLTQQHFINLGSYYHPYYIIFFINFCFSFRSLFFFNFFLFYFIFLFSFYLFDTVNDKLSSFYNYLILLKHTCSQWILFSILTWWIIHCNCEVLLRRQYIYFHSNKWAYYAGRIRHLVQRNFFFIFVWFQRVLFR